MDVPESKEAKTGGDAAPGDRSKPALTPLQEALARQAAMRPKKGPPKTLPLTPRLPKVKIGRKNRRKIPKPGTGGV